MSASATKQASSGETRLKVAATTVKVAAAAVAHLVGAEEVRVSQKKIRKGCCIAPLFFLDNMHAHHLAARPGTRPGTSRAPCCRTNWRGVHRPALQGGEGKEMEMDKE